MTARRPTSPPCQTQADIDALTEERLERLLRVVPGLATLELRARTVARELEGAGPLSLAALSGHALRVARDRRSAATVVSALAHALERRWVDEELVAAARDAARSRADRLAEALLAAGPAKRRYNVDDEHFVDRRMRALALGTRRAMSRVQDRDLLARLAHDQDPLVIRGLLANPRCTEREALLVASRRPTRPEVLEVVLASRFATSQRTRRAIAQNPYATVSLAVRAMATLHASALRMVLEDEQMVPAVRDHARSLLVARGVRPAERHARAQEPEDVEASKELERLLKKLEREVED